MNRITSRGRPRGFSADDVLDRAITVFWTRGYAATAISDLVEATGLNPPSLYAAFGSKRGMFLAVLARYVQTLGRGAVDALASAPPGEACERFADATLLNIFDGQTGRGCLLANVAGDAAADDPEIRDATQRYMALAVAALDTAGRKSGLPEGDLLLAILHAAAIRARTGSSPEEVKALILRLLGDRREPANASP